MNKTRIIFSVALFFLLTASGFILKYYYSKQIYCSEKLKVCNMDSNLEER